ncbi:MAG TPA: hypothetical protein VHV55_23775 [Pirellulales bacterium]|nr:hypothetical protein [Pirellulales bacterium]
MAARLQAWMRRPAGRIVLAGTLVGSLAAFWWVKGPEIQVQYWQSKLADDDTDDEDVAFAVGKLARLGPPGIAALVDDLNSDRPVIAMQSKRVLLESLARLESTTPEAGDDYRLALARALDEQIDRFAPPAKTAAADLAMRILTVPQSSNVSQSARLTALCDRVLRAKAGYADARLDAADVHARHASITTMLAQPHLCASPEPEGLRRPKLAPIADRIALPDLDEPALLAVPADARPISALAEVDYAVVKPAPPLVIDSRVQLASAIVANAEADRLAHLPGIELFKLLAQPPGPETAAVKAEIKRRKFTPREIEVGVHLCSPRADDRCRWAEALPGLSGIDAKMWLLWLSRDVSPQVRLTAVTLMATASDPELLARVGEMARSDRDDRVQEQAARIIEQASDDGN